MGRRSVRVDRAPLPQSERPFVKWSAGKRADGMLYLIGGLVLLVLSVLWSLSGASVTGSFVADEAGHVLVSMIAGSLLYRGFPAVVDLWRRCRYLVRFWYGRGLLWWRSRR